MPRPSTVDEVAIRAAFARGDTRKEVAARFGVKLDLLVRRLSLWAVAGREMPGDGARRRTFTREGLARMKEGHVSDKVRGRGLERCLKCHLLEPHACVRTQA